MDVGVGGDSFYVDMERIWKQDGYVYSWIGESPETEQGCKFGGRVKIIDQIHSWFLH